MKSKGGFNIKKEEIRVNDEIRAREVRVIDPEGNQIGVMDVKKALEIAESYFLDLVEVAPTAKPPVCRIMDYGKYKYQLSKKEKKSKKKQHIIQIKEIRFRPNIEEHDIKFKIDHARKFINSGYHLRIRILFKGRQLAHPELGKAVLDRIIKELEDIAQLEKEPVNESRSIVATFIKK